MQQQPKGAGPKVPTMDRRRFLLVTLGGASALALGACSSTKSSTANSNTTAGSGTQAGGEAGSPPPAPRATVRLPFGAFGFPTPFSSNGPPGYVQMSLLYDTLMWKDGTGELLPWLAKSVQRSADNLNYTFELRDGLKWSDGVPLTADDVVFTFDYYAKQENIPPPVIAQPPQGVTKTVATGPTTVTITVDRPDVTFEEQVAGTIPIVPRHIWSTIADPVSAQDVKVLVGSGAYKLDSAYQGDGGPLLYTANDQYFLGVPFVKRIEYTNADDQFAALLGGTADSASGPGLRNDTLAPFKRDSGYGIVTEKGASTTALYFNLKKGGALADAQFRRACAMAIDRKDLVARLAGGNGQPGNPGFLGPENPFLVPVKQYDLDVAGANALLDTAGYTKGPNGVRQAPGGAPVAFDLLVGTPDTPLGELVSGALKQIGVQANIKTLQPGPQLFGAKFSGKFDMALVGFPGPSAGGPNGDPDLLRAVFSSKAPPSLTGAVGYANPTFDDLADKQRGTFDNAQRKSIVAQMQGILADDVPVLQLYSPDNTFIYRKQVLDPRYITPGRYPTDVDNKQNFITGLKTGTKVRPIK